ncbi:MAG: hypothetical protein R3C15_20830 [Thermoleophilia bacterium]
MAVDGMRQTARFTMVSSEGAGAVLPAGTGSVDVDLGLAEVQFDPATPATASGADAEQADDRGQTTMLYDLRSQTVYSDISWIERAGLAHDLNGKRWLRTPLSELGDLSPPTDIFFNPSASRR